jgi:predicted MFS family arabinose efflux permease
MEYLRYFYGAGTIISALVLCFAPDGKKGYDEEGEPLRSKAFWQHLKLSFTYVMQHKVLWFLFGAMGLFLIVDELTGLIRTPYLEELGFAIENLGYLSAIIGVIGIIIPLGIEKLLHKKQNSAFVLSCLLGVFSLLLLFAGLYSSLWVLILLYLLYSFIDDVLFPVDAILTNQLIEAPKRATVLSMKSVIENLSSILGAPLMGRIL